MRSTRLSGQMSPIGSRSAPPGVQGWFLFNAKCTQAPAHVTWFGKLTPPPKSHEEEPQNRRNDERVKRKQTRSGVPSEAFLRDLRLRFASPTDPPPHFYFFFFFCLLIFLHSRNNTGQLKSASQNNWLSHRTRSHLQQSQTRRPSEFQQTASELRPQLGWVFFFF